MQRFKNIARKLLIAFIVSIILCCIPMTILWLLSFALLELAMQTIIVISFIGTFVLVGGRFVYKELIST